MLIRRSQHYQAYLDASTPYTTYRWVGSGVLLCLFFLRIFLAQGWYIGMTLSSPYKWNQQSENDALQPQRAGAIHPRCCKHLHKQTANAGILNHSRLYTRNLPPEPLPRFPDSQVRPLSHPGRGS